MTTNPGSSAKAALQALGARLREIRKEAGLTGRALAAATGQHYTRVSKLESGVQRPTAADIREWCQACGAEAEVSDLLATLRVLDSAYLEHRRAARDGMKRVVGANTVELYQRTTHWRIYEHNVIPGLFQTPDYCAAMISFWTGFLDAPNDLEEAVAVRMERQKALYQRGKRFAVILEEQALRTWFGDAETQANQLDRLLTLMSLPSVALGVIPLMTERGAVPSAGFWIYDDSLVSLETPTASIEVTRPSEVELYLRMFDNLHGVARYGKPARELITRVARELA
ncbi:helix-turn-helix transcriptional regulator [Actinoplanes sp. NPDC051346]|uniref:helix-turn-helix domain-containing protein n=1 Tax=Actinoplanes sp. NPDC051346 TaxID=3155048 RepID=UPI003445BD89